MNYRPEIDGLRAVAVIPVILFHAGFGLFSGGYIGVDVFFVISGYLITSIVIAELDSGIFSLARFYERRARRILPALFTVMLACLPFAYMWILPSQLKDFAASIVSVIFGLSNLYFLSQINYFAPSAELQPLLHTWSLAVEEQYYFLFPLLLIGLWKLPKRLRLPIVLALALVSFGIAEWGWRENAARNFFFTGSRFWEIALGSLCAFVLRGRAAHASAVLSGIGAGLIVFSIFYFDASTPFPSAYALAPTVGTALIILFAAPSTEVARLLSHRAFVGIGLISYSAYLWHQPLFAFARLRSLTHPSPVLMVSLAVATLLLAWATWALVERPFRGTQPLLATRARVFGASVAMAACFVAIGVAGYVGKGFDWRSNGDTSFAALDQRIASNPGLSWDCVSGFTASPNCVHGTHPNVLLWGDSFAMHLAQGLTKSAGASGFTQQTMSQCSPILGAAQVSGWAGDLNADRCFDFNNRVLAQITANPVDVVILSSPFNSLIDVEVQVENGATLPRGSIQFAAKKLRETVDLIRATGARVVIVSPPPTSGWDNGQCLMRSAYFKDDATGCDFALDLNDDPLAMLRSVEDKVAIYWIYSDLCENGICDALMNDIFMYRDAFHLSLEGSSYLGHQHNWMARMTAMAN